LSNPDNLDSESPYLAAKRQRFRVTNLVGFGSETKRNEFCLPCYNSGLGRLIPSPKPDQKDMLYCRNCGTSYNNSDIDEQQKETKLGLKHGEGQSKTFMISKKSKGSKPRKQVGSVNDELTDEDISDLRSSGINVS